MNTLSKSTISKIRGFDKKTLVGLLAARKQEQLDLFETSKKIKESVFENKVWFRGLIEFSNICQNNCLYCGIRKGNKKQKGFIIGKDEIFDCLNFIDKAKYGSVVFQSGELNNEKFKNFLLQTIKDTRSKYPSIGITISCGELGYDFFKRLKKAGADRYLLRIESSNPILYAKMHPSDMSWQKRYENLKYLQKLNYQTGTGVMVGLPEQTIDDLIGDLKFFVENKFDMFGIGPYVIHEDTPFGKNKKIKSWWEKNKQDNFNLFLNFISLLRILMPTANIAAATACDVFDPLGRIKVLQIAGNIIMPSVTPIDYREQYLLYQNKPCVDEDSNKCFECISKKIITAGLRPVYGELGTSPFYQSKHSNV